MNSHFQLEPNSHLVIERSSRSRHSFGSLAQTDVFTPSLGSGLSVVRSTKGGSVSSYVSVSNLHGDTVTSLLVPSSGFVSGPTELNVFDEYGVQQTPAVVRPDGLGARFDASALFLLGYGSEGAGKRETTDSGLMFMGVRAFNPVTGQFLSQDPVPGGNETAYNYPNDPINGSDLSGAWGWGDIDWQGFGVNFGLTLVAGIVIGAMCGLTAGIGCLVSGMVVSGIAGMTSGALEADRLGYKGAKRTQLIFETAAMWALSSGAARLTSGILIKAAVKNVKIVRAAAKTPKFAWKWLTNRTYAVPNSIYKFGLGITRQLLSIN